MMFIPNETYKNRSIIAMLQQINIQATANISVQSALCKAGTLEKTKIGFQDQLLVNAGQKYSLSYYLS